MTDYEFLHEFEKHNPEIKEQLLTDMNNMLKQKNARFYSQTIKILKIWYHCKI